MSLNENTASSSHFFQLTPENILDGTESLGLKCTGRCLQLNSLENRVYELELDKEVSGESRYERFVVAKFYRPQRWTRDQILEEHSFLRELHEQDISVVPPLLLGNNETLHQEKHSGILFTLFPKVGGRNPDELDEKQLEQLGRLIARMHNVAIKKKASHRPIIHPDTYAKENLAHLIKGSILPKDIQGHFETIIGRICELSHPLFSATSTHRLHGDCHYGNILWTDKGPTIVDFDDMASGPAIQDMWLLFPGRDAESAQKREALLRGYEMMKKFDRASLRLVEPLRALRYIHYATWIAKRWEDPFFPRTFPTFGTVNYWQVLLNDLREQLGLIEESVWSSQY